MCPRAGVDTVKEIKVCSFAKKPTPISRPSSPYPITIKAIHKLSALSRVLTDASL
jgi:hypothetical protein